MADQPPLVTAGEDFDACKIIIDKLQSIPTKERQERVLRWVAEAAGLAMPTEPPRPGPPPPAPPGHEHVKETPQRPDNRRAHTDIRTFVESKQPSTDIQFVTVVAHYYRFEAPEPERRETINAEFAQQATRLANWDRLTNARSTLANAVNKGYLDRRGDGEFAVNVVGENLVARALPIAKASGRGKGGKSAAASTGAGRKN